MRYAPLALLLAVAPVAAQVSPLDVRPGAASSQPVPIGEAGGRLVFGADDGAGRGLFATDGTTVDRLAEGWAQYQGMGLGGALYLFLCDDGPSCSLARTDGTASGTVRVAALGEVERLGYPAATADRLFFLLRPGGADGTQLWTSDGTAAGTRAVEGAWPVVNDGLRYVVTAAAGRVFFSAGSGGPSCGRRTGTAPGRPPRSSSPDGEVGSSTGRRSAGTDGRSRSSPRPSRRASTPSARTAASWSLGSRSGRATRRSCRSATASCSGRTRPPTRRASPTPVAFYAASADGVRRVSPDLPAAGLRDHAVVSRLGDGSVALAVGPGEVWRVAPGRQAALAFRLPTGEAPFSHPGIFEVARETRPAPAVALADGVLHALTLRDDGTYSLWRDAGDGTAQLLASYRPDDPDTAPQFAEAGGVAYVTFETPGAGFELVALGRAATDVPPSPSAGPLAVEIEGAHPVRAQTRLRVTAAPGARVRVEAFDALGRRVGVLLDGPAPGEPLGFNTSGLAPGVYVVRAATETERAAVRVVVAR